MAENFKDRAEQALRDRHTAKIRELAVDIQTNAGYLLADLEHGRANRTWNLVSDAQEIAERIRALEAINELAAIYKADEAGQ